jgi:hypothetical protein
LILDSLVNINCLGNAFNRRGLLAFSERSIFIDRARRTAASFGSIVLVGGLPLVVISIRVLLGLSFVLVVAGTARRLAQEQVPVALEKQVPVAGEEEATGAENQEERSPSERIEGIVNAAPAPEEGESAQDDE